MKKTNYILTALIVLLITSNIILLIRLNSIKNNGFNEEVISLQSRLSYLKAQWHGNLINCGAVFDLETNFKTDTSFVTLNKLLVDYCLIFRIHEHDCEPCISFGMSKIKKQFSEYKEKVYIISQAKDARSIKIMKNAYGIDNQIFGIESVPIDIDSHLIPYYFVVNKEGVISDIFIPDKAFPDLTDYYLTCIQEKYFNNSSNPVK